MKWTIPAKTFLLGEYVALVGSPAIVMTTTPCFEVILSDKYGLQGIHEASPAGRFWLHSPQKNHGLEWYDPYHGSGGVGASSAQFVGAYYASKYLQQKPYDQRDMLDQYKKYASTAQGCQPSGYDVWAQTLYGCVYMDQDNNFSQSYPWPFEDITFLLVHTGKKLATHHHLQTLDLPQQLQMLTQLVEQGKQAFDRKNSAMLVEAVNAYHGELKRLHLVAEHSLDAISSFRMLPEVLAVKGCGAMGADVILLLISTNKKEEIIQNLSKEGWNLLATQENLKNYA